MTQEHINRYTYQLESNGFIQFSSDEGIITIEERDDGDYDIYLFDPSQMISQPIDDAVCTGTAYDAVTWFLTEPTNYKD